MQPAVQQFLSRFLTPPKGGSSSILTKLTHWISVFNSPEEFYPNADLFELRSRRRNARQSVRRILSKHPELIPTVTQIMEESQVRQ